jgi:hypothetical protein
MRREERGKYHQFRAGAPDARHASSPPPPSPTTTPATEDLLYSPLDHTDHTYLTVVQPSPLQIRAAITV